MDLAPILDAPREISPMGQSSDYKGASPLLSQTLGAGEHLTAAGVAGPLFKDECSYGFDTPFSEHGLLLNLKTMRATGQGFLRLDQARTGAVLYLKMLYTKVRRAEEEAEAEAGGSKTDETTTAADEPTRLAIGVEGGFGDVQEKFDVEKRFALMLHNADFDAWIRYPLGASPVPEAAAAQLEAIIARDSAAHEEAVEAYDEEAARRVSQYADALMQVEGGVAAVSPNPADWVCGCGCGLRENLWLNLSDGYIGGGRRNWDGSGGCGAALDHYEATGGLYPLCCKLGTITTQEDGTVVGDVFSYAPDEDDMVLDPKLPEHLRFHGINPQGLEKTDKSMTELMLELNMTFDFDAVTEGGKALVPVCGPGHVGLKNLGNSCYMNSTLQLLASVPEVVARYGEPAATALFASAPEDIHGDAVSQMAKVVTGLTSARHTTPEVRQGEDAEGASNSVEPRAFKTLVGRGHAEFSSGRQQDAIEYLQHLLSVLTRSERANGDRVSGQATEKLFTYKTETRTQCNQSGQAKYQEGTEMLWSLPVPMEASDNAAEVAADQERRAALSDRERLRDNALKPNVPFAACVAAGSATETVDDFLSPVTGERGSAQRHTRFATMPKYLLVQMRKFYLDATWTPKKREVTVPVPEDLDIEHLRATGPQEGEQLMPSEEEAAAAAAPAAPAEPSPEIVATITGMGFSENAAKRAALAVDNAGPEAATEWLFGHMEDADLNDPPPAPEAAAPAAAPAAAAPAAAGPDPAVLAEAVGTLGAMGFTAEQVEAAMIATDSNMERAADWLFSHADDMDSAVREVTQAAAAEAAEAAAGPAPLDDGPGQYSLAAFVSHVGPNSGSGHYVCHAKKDGRWVILDDSRVALSEDPPTQHSYLLLFSRNA